MKSKGLIAPDGGWGWVVAFASTVTYFLAFGVTSIGGLLMLTLTSQVFPESRNKSIWIPVLCNGTSRLLAPVAIYLSKKTSYRTVIFAGGILLALGFALSFSATSFDLLFIYFGFIIGTGVSFCAYPPCILTTLYFDKHASLANGIFTAGQALGCIIFPLCVDWVTNLVGIRSTFLYLGGLSLQICIAAALCQPVEWHLKKAENVKIETQKIEIEDEKTQSGLKSSFLINSNFYFLSLGLTGMYLIMATYPIIIPEFALEFVPETYSLDRTAYLLSAGATADFLTRSFSSWVFDLSFINRTYCFFGACLMFGLVVVMSIFVPNFTVLLIVCVFSGISCGVCSILAAVVYKEKLGEKNFGLALTTTSLVSGILCILVGSSVGWLRQVTGSFDVMLVIIGGYQISGVIAWLLSRFCFKQSKV